MCSVLTLFKGNKMQTVFFKCMTTAISFICSHDCSSVTLTATVTFELHKIPKGNESGRKKMILKKTTHATKLC